MVWCIYTYKRDLHNTGISQTANTFTHTHTHARKKLTHSFTLSHTHKHCLWQVAFGDKADDVEMQQQQMRARYEASKPTIRNMLHGRKKKKAHQEPQGKPGATRR